MVAASLSVTGAVLASEPASASTTKCGSGRCTMYLNRSETYHYAYEGIWVAAPPSNIGLAAVSVINVTYRAIARQYYSWGWCVGFQISIYPWETQGLFGYRC